MSDERLLAVLTDVRNWVRVASYGSVRNFIESALPDAKSRSAYQMFDGKNTMEQVRAACKMCPNNLIALADRWNCARHFSVTISEAIAHGWFAHGKLRCPQCGKSNSYDLINDPKSSSVD